MRFSPSNHLVKASPLPLNLGYLFLGIQHSPVGGCSAESCDFRVLAGEDKYTSFSTILFVLAPWKKSYDEPRQHIKKKRHCFAHKGLSSQNYGFSSSHVWLWELDYKEAEHWRIDAFELWCWRRLLRVPWTARRFNQSILKEISPE